MKLDHNFQCEVLSLNTTFFFTPKTNLKVIKTISDKSNDSVTALHSCLYRIYEQTLTSGN